LPAFETASTGFGNRLLISEVDGVGLLFAGHVGDP
jgi:hypothetical protein